MAGEKCPKCKGPYLVFRNNIVLCFNQNCNFKDKEIEDRVEYYEEYQKEDDFYQQRNITSKRD